MFEDGDLWTGIAEPCRPTPSDSPVLPLLFFDPSNHRSRTLYVLSITHLPTTTILPSQNMLVFVSLHPAPGCDNSPVNVGHLL